MKKLNLFVTLLLAVTFCFTAPAWSLDEADHVALAPNNVGDTLIYPLYVAFPGGWGTKITVINTDEANSVVAKVVVRGGRFTQELLDFLIYLSPADVWTGHIVARGNSVWFVSRDDSVRASSTTWASSTVPFEVNMSEVNTGFFGGCDWAEIGYVEIFEAWSLPTPNGPGSVTKAQILGRYDTAAGAQLPGTGVALDVLTGHYEVYNDTLGLLAANEATVLMNHNATQLMTIGAETYFDAAQFRNSICEVEAVLAKTNLALPYYNGGEGKFAFHVFTFPTKLSAISTNNCAYMTPLFSRSPFFLNNHTSRAVNFGLDYYDLSEKRGQQAGPIISPQRRPTLSFPTEVNFSSPYSDSDTWTVLAGFAEGWADYAFDNYTTTCNPWVADRNIRLQDRITFNGAPTIAQTVIFTNDMDALAIMPAAYTPSTVSYSDAGAAAQVIPFYQYNPGVNYTDTDQPLPLQ